ncbi:MAG: glycosyltransferase [Oscillospiraceae bacterium]|nr:glycosyltransferase [Oscillospiraceae bacterium]MBQ6902525.1 glycosyltransferase [Oscillospiraceae bacterium]
MNKIVCLSTSCYHPFPTRKQHVMNRISADEILYFDPPVTYIAPLKDKNAWKRLFMYRKPGEHVRDNITVYATPPVLPFFNKNRLINKINQKRLARFVRKKMKLHGFENPILWCYSPTSADAAPYIPHSALVYDCVDRHSAYKGFINEEVVNTLEKNLAEQANTVFATAAGLYDTLSAYNKNAVMLPNGVNFEHFNRAANEQFEAPDDIKDIKHPIVGFVGMLQECIDYDKIEHIAKMRPDWSVVLIGKPLPGVNLDYLKQYPNIHFLGMKKYDDLPAYIKCFDVCLNVFRDGNLSRDVSPLKFYEYLATGKPVVSTPQPEQVLIYSDSVYIAHGAEEFLEKCEEAMVEPDSSKTELRIEHARSCSWDARVRQMEEILKNNGVE